MAPVTALTPSMNQNKLFSQTRLRLASWYALVMGFILSLCGFGLYEAIVHAHLQTLDRELEAVAGTLHDSIESILTQPGRIELAELQPLPEQEPKRHILGAIYQGNYYMRLLDNSGRIVAEAGFVPQNLPVYSDPKKGWFASPSKKHHQKTSPNLELPPFPLTNPKSKIQNPKSSDGTTWQTLKDAAGNRYHQISLSLHTQDYRHWGVMQMGRSLKDVDDYLKTVQLILFVGLPIAMILVGGASWGLAGLAMKPIYQSYSQIQQFTADAAHELRTPLAATQATIESALDLPHLDENEARDILQTIDRQNRRLTQLVADLLLLARLERQAVPMRLKPCCLNDLVNDLIEELEALAIAHHVSLTAEFRISNQIEVLGDEEQLYRLVSNLMVNGIQYTPAGGKVTLILGRSDHYALIQVEDTGVGIAQSEQKLIFDRFYRINSDRSRSTGGSGLGLGIAQAIAQAHKGSLQVASELGQGSTFTIRLPMI